MLAGNSYIGRLAPSPTGLLHLGHALTFHAAAKRARVTGGQLLLRIDDLDRERSKAQFTDAIVEDLAWLGVRWEPPLIEQSRRVGLYRATLERLIRAGAAYPCSCSRRDLMEAPLAPHEEDDEPIYNGKCRSAWVSGFVPGVNYRMQVPDGERVSFVDGNLGERGYVCGKDFGDFLLWRKDDLPSYQLATVVDDAEMGVTEVVRGRDLLKSTARQILVARAMGLPSPEWWHVELVRDADGVRMAKRSGAMTIRSLRESGLTAAEVIALAERGMTTVIRDY
jgi:glutamyl/glutaminyl-tRNA synthetase